MLLNLSNLYTLTVERAYITLTSTKNVQKSSCIQSLTVNNPDEGNIRYTSTATRIQNYNIIKSSIQSIYTG